MAGRSTGQLDFGKIEEGIPIPKPTGAASGLLQALMELQPSEAEATSQSRLIKPGEGVDVERLRNRIYATAKRANIKVSAMEMNGGIRVWRRPDGKA